MIGKSNQEVLVEDENRKINQYAVGDQKQENKSMTPELIAAYAFDKFFKNPATKGTLTYAWRQRDVKDPDDEGSYVVNWESLPVSDRFQQRLRNMLVFSLCYSARIYPVIQNNETDTTRYHWLGKCVNDLNPPLCTQAAAINDYCKAFIYWALDICSAGPRSKDKYELINYAKVMRLKDVAHDTEADYGDIVVGAKKEKSWNRIWEGINGNAKVYETDRKASDDKRIGLNRLVTDIYDEIQ